MGMFDFISDAAKAVSGVAEGVAHIAQGANRSVSNVTRSVASVPSQAFKAASSLSFTHHLNTQIAAHPQRQPITAVKKVAMIHTAMKQAPPTSQEKALLLAHASPAEKKAFSIIEQKVQTPSTSPPSAPTSSTPTVKSHAKVVGLGLSAGATILMAIGAPIVAPLALAGGAVFFLTRKDRSIYLPVAGDKVAGIFKRFKISPAVLNQMNPDVEVTMMGKKTRAINVRPGVAVYLPKGTADLGPQADAQGTFRP